MFGVNFADGRIKGYPTGPMPGQTVGNLYAVFAMTLRKLPKMDVPLPLSPDAICCPKMPAISAYISHLSN